MKRQQPRATKNVNNTSAKDAWRRVAGLKTDVSRPPHPQGSLQSTPHKLNTTEALSMEHASELATMRARLRELTQVVEKLQKENAGLHEVLEITQRERDTVRKNTHSAITKAMRASEEKIMENHTKQSEIEALLQALARTRGELKKAAELQEQSREEVAELEQALESERTRARAEINLYKTELEATSAHLSTARDAVVAAEYKADQVRKEALSVTTSLGAERDAWLSERKRLDQSAEALRRGLDAKTTENTGLVATLHNVKEEYARVQESIQKHIQEKDAIVADIGANCESLQNELRLSQAHVTELQAARDRLSDKLARVRDEAANTQQQMRLAEENLVSDMKDAVMQVKGMQEARDQAQNELAEFRERANMEADQLQNDIRVLQQELSQMASASQEVEAGLARERDAVVRELEDARCALDREASGRAEDAHTQMAEISRMERELADMAKAFENSKKAADENYQWLARTKDEVAGELTRTREQYQLEMQRHSNMQQASLTKIEELTISVAKSEASSAHAQELVQQAKRMQEEAQLKGSHEQTMLSNEVQQLRQAAADAAAARMSAEAAAEQARQELRELGTQTGTAAREAQQEVARLEKALVQQEGETARARDAVHAAEERSAAKAAALEEAQMSHRAAAQEAALDAERAAQEAGALKDSLAKEKEEKASVLASKAAVEEKAAALTVERDSLQRDLQERNFELDQSRRAGAAAERAAEVAMQKVAAADEELRQAQREFAETEKKLTAQLQAATFELGTVKHELERAQKDLRDTQQALEVAEAEGGRLKQEVAGLREELREECGRVEQLQSEVQKVKREAQEAAEASAAREVALKHSLQETERKCSALQQEVEAAEVKVAEAIDKLEREAERFKKEVERVQQEAQERTSKIKSELDELVQAKAAQAEEFRLEKKKAQEEAERVEKQNRETLAAATKELQDAMLRRDEEARQAKVKHAEELDEAKSAMVEQTRLLKTAHLDVEQANARAEREVKLREEEAANTRANLERVQEQHATALAKTEEILNNRLADAQAEATEKLRRAEGVAKQQQDELEAAMQRKLKDAEAFSDDARKTLERKAKEELDHAKAMHLRDQEQLEDRLKTTKAELEATLSNKAHACDEMRRQLHNLEASFLEHQQAAQAKAKELTESLQDREHHAAELQRELARIQEENRNLSISDAEWQRSFELQTATAAEHEERLQQQLVDAQEQQKKSLEHAQAERQKEVDALEATIHTLENKLAQGTQKLEAQLERALADLTTEQKERKALVEAKAQAEASHQAAMTSLQEELKSNMRDAEDALAKMDHLRMEQATEFQNEYRAMAQHIEQVNADLVAERAEFVRREEELQRQMDDAINQAKSQIEKEVAELTRNWTGEQESLRAQLVAAQSQVKDMRSVESSRGSNREVAASTATTFTAQDALSQDLHQLSNKLSVAESTIRILQQECHRVNVATPHHQASLPMLPPPGHTAGAHIQQLLAMRPMEPPSTPHLHTPYVPSSVMPEYPRHHSSTALLPQNPPPPYYQPRVHHAVLPSPALDRLQTPRSHTGGMNSNHMLMTTPQQHFPTPTNQYNSGALMNTASSSSVVANPQVPFEAARTARENLKDQAAHLQQVLDTATGSTLGWAP